MEAFVLMGPILGIILFIAPLMMWSHLREQTKLLKQIEEHLRK